MKNTKSTCENLAWLVAILGSIGSCYLAYKFGVTLRGYSYTYLERDWVLTLTILACGALSTAALSVPLFALAEIIGKIDRLLVNNSQPLSSNNSEVSKPESSATLPEEHAAKSPSTAKSLSDNALLAIAAALFGGVILLALFMSGVL